jgi:hypothetical protein
MVWYVALVAILNIAMGYALAVYLGAGRRDARPQPAADEAEPYDSYRDSDEYESAELSELESAAAG